MPGRKSPPPYKIIDGKRQQGVTGFYSPKGIHSAKPEEMRKMIEKVSYAPRIELFAREKHEGWDVWGDEVVSSVELTNNKEGNGLCFVQRAC